MSIGYFDHLMWAKKPMSQHALDLLIAGARDGDKRMEETRSRHVSNGVSDKSGRLLQRWDGLQWVLVSAERYRDAA